MTIAPLNAKILTLTAIKKQREQQAIFTDFQERLENVKKQNVLSDVTNENGLSRVVTNKDGTSTEFYYNQDTKTLEVYEKKVIDGNGNAEIVNYKRIEGVNGNPIGDDKGLETLVKNPTSEVVPADKSGFSELTNIEEFKSVKNVQFDYDTNGNKSCMIMLDANGNRIGHMWLTEQNQYGTDNKPGELVMYGSGARYQIGTKNDTEKRQELLQQRMDLEQQQMQERMDMINKEYGSMTEFIRNNVNRTFNIKYD